MPMALQVSEMGKYVQILKEKPQIVPKQGEPSLATKILQEYLDSGQPFGQVAFEPLKENYKNVASLARILGRTVKAREITGVSISSDSENVYLLREE